ncbi:MAG: type II toxin-antitoxin system VapC family toxin [Asticcacaulis sp.]
MVAVLTNEPERLLFVSKPDGADSLMLSAANLMEARMVLYRRNPAFLEHLDSFVVPVSGQDRTCHRFPIRYCLRRLSPFRQGIGPQGRPELRRLFSPMPWRANAVPLCCSRGDDFAHTDITPA